MIQRIQTIWFIVAAICIAALPFLAPVSAIANVDFPSYFSQILFGIIGLILLMTIFAIFRYKDRKGQRLLANLLMLDVVILGLVYFGFLYATGGIEALTTGTNSQINATFLGLMSLAIFGYALAKRGIVADEKLLKSVDRLRD